MIACHAPTSIERNRSATATSASALHSPSSTSGSRLILMSISLLPRGAPAEDEASLHQVWRRLAADFASEEVEQAQRQGSTITFAWAPGLRRASNADGTSDRPITSVTSGDTSSAPSPIM